MQVPQVGYSAPVSRRDFLKVGLTTASATVLSVLPNGLFASQPGGDVNFAANYKVVPVGNRQRPIVMIWLEGGMSHFDTFSTNPTAQENVRGVYSTIQTSLPGLRISEKLPLTARHMNRVALMRNIKHRDSNHSTATSLMFSGSSRSDGNKSAIDSFTMRMNKYLGEANVGYVTFNADTSNPSFYPGVGQTDSLYVRQLAPSAQEQLTALNTGNTPYPSPFGVDFDRERQRDRNALLGRLGSRVESPQTQRWDVLRERANSMLDGDLNRAFNLEGVAARERDKYGRTSFGNAGLIAKRMVDAGAPFVLINKFGWDNHSNIRTELDNKLPELDKIIASLMEDLGSRAIIAVGTEFGRTPMNSSAGRDHWPQSNFLFIGGAGIEGRVYGELDNTGHIADRSPVFAGELMGPTIARAAGYEFVEERSGVLTTNKLPYLPIFGG